MLKTRWALLFLVLLGARPAGADTLVTGAIRDRSGAAIVGARVTAFGATGQPVGHDVALADGTFAIAASEVPAQIGVTCDYCEPVRRAVDPAQPSVIIVERFTAVTAAGPSAEDVRALPYRAASDLATLRPLTVVTGSRISDRGLDYEGVTLIEGLPFYRAADGNDFAQLVPAHATARLDTVAPPAAPVYGGYADAGVYDLRLHDEDLPTSRFETGDSSDAVLRFDADAGGAVYAASSDASDDRQAGAARATLPLAGGRLAIDALDLVNLTDHASGAALGYSTDSRRYTTVATFSATQSDTASLLTAAARVRNRGPLGLEFGARTSRATSVFGDVAGVQLDEAVYAAAGMRHGAGGWSAIAAWDRGSNGGIGAAGPAAGLVGSLTEDVRLNAHWSTHAGVNSNLRIPTFAEVAAVAPAVISGDRSLLYETALTYEDLRRLRLTGSAYARRSTGSATGHVNGLGIDAAWQIAPQVTLRSWLLRANQSSTPVGSPEAPYYAAAVTEAGPLTRQLIWLSYEHGVRFDALVRGGGLEGDVRIPLGSTYAFTIGSAIYDGRRTTTFGLTRR